MPRNYAKKKKSHKAAMAMIAMSNRDKKEELDRQQKEIESLENLISEQENRTLELQNLKVYVKTMKYVEDKAKELGLVYPDEILYKPK